jgi:hypothetical protein
MGRKLRKVVREDLKHMDWFLTAIDEGRVRIEITDDSVSRHAVINNVRAYVARIEGIAAKKYRDSIKCIWDKLLETDNVADMMMPSARARKCQEFDKYNVVRVIGVLMEHGFYDYHEQQDIMEMLEGERENSYRSYLGKGIDDAVIRRDIRAILEEFEI